METSLTLTEASEVLDPRVSESRLRMLVRALGVKPCGVRHTGKRGHPERTYDWADLLDLHAAVAKWLARLPG